MFAIFIPSNISIYLDMCISLCRFSFTNPGTASNPRLHAKCQINNHNTVKNCRNPVATSANPKIKHPTYTSDFRFKPHHQPHNTKNVITIQIYIICIIPPNLWKILQKNARIMQWYQRFQAHKNNLIFFMLYNIKLALLTVFDADFQYPCNILNIKYVYIYIPEYVENVCINNKHRKPTPTNTYMSY